MDITFKTEKHTLNVRGTAIIIHNNKVLMHRSVNEPYHALVGGRVKLGESSEQTVKREVMEELGKEVDVTGYCCTIENFFNFRNSEYHEIMFVHFAEFKDEDDKKIEHTIKNAEGREDLEYRWLDLDKIDEYEIKPVVMKEVLKNKKFPVHVINDDR